MRFIWITATALILLGSINLTAEKPSWECSPWTTVQRGGDVPGPSTPG